MAETLSERIRRVRLRRNLTQHELADRAGISRIHLARLETDKAGAVQPRVPTIRKLAAALEVDAEWLRAGSKLPRDPSN